MWFMVGRWSQSQKGDWARPHSDDDDDELTTADDDCTVRCRQVVDVAVCRRSGGSATVERN